MVVQWLNRPYRSEFEAQTMHSFLVLFHLVKVVSCLKFLQISSRGGGREVGGKHPVHGVFSGFKQSFINNGCYFSVFLLLFLENVRGDQLKNRLIPLDVI